MSGETPRMTPILILPRILKNRKNFPLFMSKLTEVFIVGFEVGLTPPPPTFVILQMPPPPSLLPPAALPHISMATSAMASNHGGTISHESVAGAWRWDRSCHGWFLVGMPNEDTSKNREGGGSLASDGRLLVLDTTINRYSAAVIGGMTESMRRRGGVYRGGVFLFSGQRIERQKKLQK